MVEYVCGFMFALDYSQVALIRKNKPEWQKGKLNGIGGKIEMLTAVTGHGPLDLPRFLSYEKPNVAMAREFEEETGYATRPEDWTTFRIERFATEVDVHFMSMSWGESSMPPLKNMTDEQIAVVNIREGLRYLRKDMMYNLPYLIEMAIALGKLRDDGLRPLP